MDYESYAREQLGVELRPVQRALLPRIENAFVNNEVVLLEAPTGVGKSLIPLLFAHAYPDIYLTVVTPTVYLQHQYERDLRRWFPTGEYSIMKGRRNYPCPYLREKYPGVRDFTAADCVIVNELGQRCPFAYKASQRALYDVSLRSEIFNGSYAAGIFPNYVAYFKDSRVCPYYYARLRSAGSRIVVTNYDYFFLDYFTTHTLHFPHLIVFDEAHALFDRISSRFSFRINLNDPVFKHFGIDVSSARLIHSSRSTEFVYFATSVVSQIEDVLSDEDVFREAVSDVSTLSLYHRLQSYYQNLRFLIAVPRAYAGRVRFDGHRISAWIEAFRFLREFINAYLSDRPLVLSDGSDDFPFYSYPEDRRILMMSATLGSPYMWRTVFDGVRFEFIGNIPSPFPVERRKIYYPLYSRDDRIDLSGYNSNPNENTLRRVVYEILRGYDLVSRYFDRPGVVVHAYLRSLASDIYMSLLSEFEQRGIEGNVFIASSSAIDPSEDTTLRDIIEQFIASGGILVSTTAAAEGVDLRDDLARLQYIVKLPYPNDYFTEFIDFRVAKTVVQMAGRVVRSVTDFGYTIVLDVAARWHFLRSPHYYPLYYREAVELDLTLDDIYSEIESYYRRFGGEVR